MPLATPIVKPSPYNITRDSIATEWQPLWDKLVRAYPFWDFGSTNINEVKSGADGIANTNVWVNGVYGPALDFAGTTSHVQTPGFAPPARGMVIFLAKFDSGNGATPVHGSLDFECRVSGGNKLLHQFYNRTLTATNYDVPYGSYTLAGLGWDASTGNGPLYKDGVLLQTKTGHNVSPGTLTNMYIGSSGSSRYLDGLMEMVLVLSDWPTQVEWDMLASDPFGWSRQATVPSDNVYSGTLQSSGTSTFVLNGSRIKSSQLDQVGTSNIEIAGVRDVTSGLSVTGGSETSFSGSLIISPTLSVTGESANIFSGNKIVNSSLLLDGISQITLGGSRVFSGSIASDASSDLLLNGNRLVAGGLVVDGTSVMTWLTSGYIDGVLLMEGSSSIYLDGSKIVNSGGLLSTGTSNFQLNSDVILEGTLHMSGSSNLLLLSTIANRETSLAGTSNFIMSGDVVPKTLTLIVSGTSDLYMSGSVDRSGKLLSVGMGELKLDSSVDMYGSFLL